MAAARLIGDDSFVAGGTERSTAVAHVLDPQHLRDDRDYRAARTELRQLQDDDSDTPAGWRLDELAQLIDEYEAALGRPAVALAQAAVSP